ncbi:phage scaffolding protein [Streptomyces griseus]|uniref:phage scaffolding protein n=1 Tax=Streptomyces griseus TaxID=1911 RepID=UPI0037B2129C
MADHDDTDIEVDGIVEEEPDAVDTEVDDLVEDAPKPKSPAKKDDPVGTEDDDYVPPSREEWERVRRTLAKRKEEKLAVQRDLNSLRDKYKEQETETERAVREAEERAEARYKPIAVNKAVRASLIQAGAIASVEGDKAKTEARLARLMKFVDIGELSIDDDGEVLGVEEQIDALRADYPELFDTTPRKRAARPSIAPKPAADETPKSAAERHAAKVLGKA